MNYLNETPFWLPGGLAAIGIVLFMAGRVKGEAKLKYAGIGAAALAIVLAVTSYLLESDREAVDRRTRELVASVAGRDWEAMQKLLSPNVRVVMFDGPEAVIAGTKWAAEKYDIQSAKVASLDVGKANPEITARIQVGASFKDVPGTVTNWKMEWEKIDGNWMLVRGTFEGGPGFGAGQLEGHLKRP